MLDIPRVGTDKGFQFEADTCNVAPAGIDGAGRKRLAVPRSTPGGGGLLTLAGVTLGVYCSVKRGNTITPR